MTDKMVTRIGWVASIMTTLMEASFVDQTRLNLSGHPGSWVLAFVAVLNNVSWIVYAVLKEKTDWPIFICSALGVVFSSSAFITALI